MLLQSEARRRERCLRSRLFEAPLRARQVQANDFVEFDYVLAMDEDNLALLNKRCPIEQRHKLQLLMHYAPEIGNKIVPDPYYGDKDDFERVLDYCEAAARGLLTALKAGRE